MNVVEENFVTFIDSNRRRSIGGILEIVPSDDGETVQLVARRREDEATGPFTWRVVNPLGGIRTFEGIRVNVPFEREVSSSVDFENGTAGAIISALGVAGSTHQIFLNDDAVGTIRTFRNEKPTFDFTGRGLSLIHI